MAQLKRTGLFNIHVQSGGKIVEFAGFEMPLQFSSIKDEHDVVRNSAGLFDVSHMGEILISGPDALKNVQNLISNDAARIPIGRVVYSGLLYPEATFVDDLLVYKIKEDKYLLCVNASNADKDFRWITSNLEGDLKCENVSDCYTQIALQGPKSLQILQPLTETNLGEMKYYRFEIGKAAGVDAIISRTGYTGELGFELYFDPAASEDVWKAIMKIGKPLGLKPTGLGCRDTLRLEAGMALYGNDIDDKHTPFEAALEWTVKMPKDRFIGKQALENQNKSGLSRRLVGFELLERAVPRHGYEIYSQNRKIGEVTSGTLSFTLNKPIGLGYVATGFESLGTEISVKIRDKMIKGKVVSYPFYSRTH
jgi:aminomethyltransferase